MSVYTSVERDQLEAFLGSYELGELQQYEGIAAGIENTNYFVDTTAGRFVLTLFEKHTEAEVDYFLALMGWLTARGVPAPAVLLGRDGRTHRLLCGKQAALVQRLDGRAEMNPDPTHCTAIGRALAEIHLAGRSFPQRRPNERGRSWWAGSVERLQSELDAELCRLLETEVTHHLTVDFSALPAGPVHTDLFRDNALFSGGELTAIIDFYSACDDVLLFDLAVCANDWCVNPDGTLDPDRGQAMLSAYGAARTLTLAEQQAWPDMLRAAAMRFLLSRLLDKHFPRDGDLTRTLDPDFFRQILQLRRADPNASAGLWPG
ncbi:MAG: homoserine kinase [Gammaproteobacteria bacterium]|nr:homoserine kinase [Gammaproteobacteria bacterium]